MQGRLWKYQGFWEETLDPAPGLLAALQNNTLEFTILKPVPLARQIQIWGSADGNVDFQKIDYVFFSIDLKRGHHHVDIYELHRHYLGFSWEVHETIQYYMFTVLPFGLASACHELLRLLIRYWWDKGLRALFYLDDGIVAVSGEAEVKEASDKVRRDLVKAGLVERTAKCSWIPSQQTLWLSFDRG